MVGFAGFCLSYWPVFKHFQLALELVLDSIETQPLLVNKV